jgi:AcrR family transcriptional regulator
MARLSRADWAAAALDALSSSGLAAVAVEPLAVRLGATKGSFYWHFRNRDELIEATLELWQEVSTSAVINRLESLGTPPGQRLRQLFIEVFTVRARPAAELALLADADHRLVAPVLAEVTGRRLEYITMLLQELGLPPARARRRAVFAYSAYLGQLQLLRSAPDVLPRRGRASAAYTDEVLAALVDPGD